MVVRSKLVVGVLAGLLACATATARDDAYEAWLMRVGDYETLYRNWWFEAVRGDAAMQERVADLLLGPHGRETRARPYEGIQFLYRAAVNGRPSAMRRLAEGLDKGKFGLRESPDAARCWSRAPADFDARLDCIRLTDFRSPRARLACSELVIAPFETRPGRRDGAAKARLCLAHKRPTLLVFGPPPGKQALARVREYKRHGIDLDITGDVYDEDFEVFRAAFNDTIVAAIDAQRGHGYMEKLSAGIEARVSGEARTRK